MRQLRSWEGYYVSRRRPIDNHLALVGALQVDGDAVTGAGRYEFQFAFFTSPGDWTGSRIAF